MRVRGTKCPECAKSKMGDTFRRNKIDRGAITLQDAFPELSLEWDFDKNKPYTPAGFTASSGKNVYWKCAQYGNSWKASISNRTCQQSGCPVCTHNQILTGYSDLATLNPDLAKEWHPCHAVCSRIQKQQAGRRAVYISRTCRFCAGGRL